MDYNKTIEKIEVLCKQRGISKTTAYNQSNVGKDFSSNIKKGNVPSSDKIIALANYFDCSVDYLLGRTDDMQISKSDIDPDLAEAIQLFANLPKEKRKELLSFMKAFCK